MKVLLNLENSVFDCQVKITDSHGSRFYFISQGDDSSAPRYITIDVFDDSFTLSLVPVISSVKAQLNEENPRNFFEKTLKMLSKLGISTIESVALRIGCDYHISGLAEGDRLDISWQEMAFRYSIFSSFVLEETPIIYCFFEVFSFNKLCKLTNAYALNRKEYLKVLKKLSLIGGFSVWYIFEIFVFPIQKYILKRFSNDKIIKRKLIKFNSFSEEKRKKFLKKMENAK